MTIPVPANSSNAMKQKGIKCERKFHIIMDPKTGNYIIILAGIILLVVGIVNQVQEYHIWNYISIIAGLIIIIPGVVGIKKGRII